MSLSIQLAQSGPYHPDSHFSGTLYLTSVESIPIGSIVITFTGLSRVTLTQNYGDLNVSNTDYHSREVLFHRAQVLYTGGKWAYSAGEYTWPFGFRVPEYADDRMMSRCPALQRTVQSTRKHDLPPAMLYSCPGFICAVEYILEATLRPPLSSPMATIGKTITAKTCDQYPAPEHCKAGEDAYLPTKPNVSNPEAFKITARWPQRRIGGCQTLTQYFCPLAAENRDQRRLFDDEHIVLWPITQQHQNVWNNWHRKSGTIGCDKPHNQKLEDRNHSTHEGPSRASLINLHAQDLYAKDIMLTATPNLSV
ncbi:uncharacterized protein Z519_10887 [Cladophialophora bantiana CBS 173.52]|uniref:Arrestin-like N-terminal domain-containing protein n=1 Tax=Cladophialophora bantiana (strain ATCC 10958 / CBS 173.52 / CDC B-1940 / NIH 8579) TaxID=1442370 RepID=A0A0D2HBL6_CLAB1|nr:uncharacterized protein Z519_10887 [Cladophialophora bantiana CBS 173.52]KIW88320.1 hypothetical protein Z519_10887 [Cladophialophora bantiana CBS 173.52]